VLLGRVILRERVQQRTWIAMALALAGVAVMVGGAGHGKLLGNAFALGTSVAFAVSVVVMRRHASISMLPATALSQVLVVAIVAPLARWDTIRLRALPLLAAFGLVPMAGGLALFTIAARLVPVADLTLLLMLEVVLGPLWVWLALAQRPSATTLIGGCGVLAAVSLQTRAAPDPVAALNAPP
jgi:drug/metabolite transporter (DMT)-like permease